MQKLLKNYPKRGEVFIADLNPGFGREIHKKRPVLVVSNNILNQNLSTIIMIPLSSIIPEFIGPDVVKIEKIIGLDKESVLIVNQIRSIDQARLVKRVGILSQDKIEQVEEALQITLGMTNLD
jgi:mRNA interferase MazF